jgi:hypothetical protein
MIFLTFSSPVVQQSSAAAAPQGPPHGSAVEGAGRGGGAVLPHPFLYLLVVPKAAFQTKDNAAGH